MTCEQARSLIQDKVDGLVGEADSTALTLHLDRCAACRDELRALLAIDAVLRDPAVADAPSWLSDAVVDEIGRRAAARRRIGRIAVGAGAPAAAAGATAALRYLLGPEAGSALRARLAEVAAGVWQPVSETLSAAARPPGFATSWSQNPGVQGFVLAMAAASLALLAVIALRLSKQLTLESR